MHFKLTDYEQIVPPAKEIPRVIRSLPNEIILRATPHSWPFRVLTASTAKWAVNVATEMMECFRRRYLDQRISRELSANKK